MSTREPNPVAILAARIMRAYPSLSPYSAASLAEELAAIERAQRRHAERCCSGADGGYVKRGRPITGYGVNAITCAIHNPDAEQRAARRILESVTRMMRRFPATDPALRVDLQGDPRGPVLLVRLPGEAEAVAV